MTQDASSPLMSKAELLEKAKSLAKPIDFDELITHGVLKKEGDLKLSIHL